MKTRSASGKLNVVKYAMMVDAEDGDNDDDNDVHYEDDGTSDGEPAPSKKRRVAYYNESPKAAGSSKGKNKGKGQEKMYRGKNVGKLAKLLEMPVDIFCEITAYLEPLDLLHLARSTRDLNNMLMSRTSKPIWRTARNYYPDLPDCPPDLSEPEYARLLFERDCHACLAPRVLKVDYVLRARLCHRCRSSNIVKGTQLIKSIPDLTEELLDCIPCRNHRWSTARQRYRRLEYYYRARVEKLVAGFRAAVPEKTPASQREDLKKAFYDHNKALIEKILEHASDVESWLLTDRITKNEEAGDAAVRRRAEITEKLIELGYSKSDFPIGWEDGQVEWSHIMDQPRDLTPRIWTTVRPKLEASIQKVKLRREERARSQRQSQRKSEVRILLGTALVDRGKRNMELHMALEDVLKLPSVEAVVSEDDWSQEVTRAKWDAAWNQIEREMNDYADRIRRKLMEYFLRSRPTPIGGDSTVSQVAASVPSPVAAEDPDFTLLYSASTLFECKHCPGMFQYPAILDHYHSWRSEWKLESFKVDGAAKIAESLLASLPQQDGGMDVATVGKRLLCLGCDENVSRPLTWTDLVRHFMDEQVWYDEQSRLQHASSLKITLHNDHALDAGSPLFTIISPQAALEQQGRVDEWSTGEPLHWKCGLCRGYARRQSKKSVELHLKKKHLRDPPEKGDTVPWLTPRLSAME